MSKKKPLNEGIVEKTLGAIWTALLKNKKDVLLKKLENDPEFQQHVKELDELRQKMEARLEKKRKTLPGFAEHETEYMKWFDKLK